MAIKRRKFPLSKTAGRNVSEIMHSLVTFFEYADPVVAQERQLHTGSDNGSGPGKDRDSLPS